LRKPVEPPTEPVRRRELQCETYLLLIELVRSWKMQSKSTADGPSWLKRDRLHSTEVPGP
jgi:hypothetical protein